jgi:tetratricopeptide (TPR) repeat protein
MNLRTAIIVKNCKDIEKNKYLYNFCKNVLVNTVFDNDDILLEKTTAEFCKQNELDAVLIINDDEEVKYLDKSWELPYVCLTDGDWIVKPKRSFCFNKMDIKSNKPTVIKVNKLPTAPKIDETYQEIILPYKEKNWNKFVVEIEKYFFHNPIMIQKSVMLHYYASIVYFFQLKNYKKGLSHICQALVTHPHMSEIWCLWADYLVETKKYSEAYQIYDTALTAGKNRNIYDSNPVWLKKYKDYPESMKGKIKKLIDETQVFEIMPQNAKYLR